MFWSLVNQTIVSDDKEELLLEMDLISKVFGDKIEIVCEKVKSFGDLNDLDIPDCEQAEYENASNFLSKIDKILKEANIITNTGKTVLILGYLDLQSMFNTRVSQLYEDQLCCPQEVQSIKKIYM